MKTIQKIFIILIVAFFIFEIMPSNFVAATDQTANIVGGVIPWSPSRASASKLQETIGRLLGFLQIASGLVAILMIAITGFNFIVATPTVEEEMKSKMLPIIIGIVLVFGAVSIAKFILGAVDDKSIDSDFVNKVYRFSVRWLFQQD